MNAFERTAHIKELSLELGFVGVGVTDLSRNLHAEHLEHWLSSGMAGTMAYMHRQAAHRLEPSTILPGAHRCVVLLRNHYNEEPPNRPCSGRIAKYARGIDYHDALRPALQKLAEGIASLGDSSTVVRAYVDAGPVPERELAQRAGLGWVGRNSMLIHPRFGSHLFIATVLTNLDIAVDQPFDQDRCGSCKSCIDSCPAGAILPGRFVDSRRCVSYLTIEHKGQIADELRGPMGDWVFGCDVCQNVCPWNIKFATVAEDPLLRLDSSIGRMDLDPLVELTKEAFAERFARTALNRTGVCGFRRNAAIALANWCAMLKTNGSPTYR